MYVCMFKELTISLICFRRQLSDVPPLPAARRGALHRGAPVLPFPLRPRLHLRFGGGEGCRGGGGHDGSGLSGGGTAGAGHGSRRENHRGMYTFFKYILCIYEYIQIYIGLLEQAMSRGVKVIEVREWGCMCINIYVYIWYICINMYLYI